MHLLYPVYLHLLWLALVPVALWLFRKRARQVAVSTLLFFRTLAREHNESAWLRTLKKWLSLALTLLVLLFAVLALARPSHDAAEGVPGAVVVLVDCSASMAARSGSSTRLDDAKAAARARVRGLPDNVVVSLVAFSGKPNVLLSRSRNHREFARLMDGLTVSPQPGDADAALSVARRLAALDMPSQIWLIGDQAVPDADVSFTDVALPTPMNVGITGFQLRKAPLSPDRYEGFVRVSAATSNAEVVTATLEARIDDRMVQLRELELKPGAAANLILPLEGVYGQRLELELKCAGDCLGWDNAMVAPLPQLKPLVVAWMADKPDPFTELALGSLVEAGRLEIIRGGPTNWPLKDTPDVYVFENWLPDAWPEGRPVIALLPTKSSGPLMIKALPQGVPVDSVRAVNAQHAVLFRINTARLSLTQHAIIEAPALETLWDGGGEPLLCAGEFNGQRVVATAFSPSRSEQLALLPAYPLLLGNALYWCAEGSEPMRDLKPLRTGDLLSASGTVRWQSWDGKAFTTASDEALGSFLELNRVGAWETSDGKIGSCMLASAAETDLPKRTATPSNATTTRIASAMSWPQRLLWAVLLLLLIESFLFHRKALY